MKKIITMLLTLAVCLSLCACGQNAPVTEAAPEETQSREEYLAELLTAESWYWGTSSSELVFLESGDGIIMYSGSNSDRALTWKLSEDKLLLVFGDGLGKLYTYDEDLGVFVGVAADDGDLMLIPASRVDEFR